MKRRGELIVPDSPEAMARVVATLLACDGRPDWRELDFLDRSGAFKLIGLTRTEFLDTAQPHQSDRLMW